MNNYVLTCCSTADMPRKFFETNDIPFVCFHYIIDGKQYDDDLGKTIPFDKFYKMMSGGTTPTTSQVNTAEFIDFFEPFLKAGKDVLHVSLSSGISGAYNSALIAKKELSEKYPNRKIEIVDSLCASSGYGLLMTKLAEKKQGGRSFEGLKDYAEKTKLLINHWFFSTDLTFYIKGGRISKAAGLFGKLLNICPLLNVDNQGKLHPREKLLGKKKVISRTVEKMKQFANNGTAYNDTCYICHSACLNDAETLKNLIEENFPALKGKVLITDVGTVIGSHTGPGTVALFFLGKNRE